MYYFVELPNGDFISEYNYTTGSFKATTNIMSAYGYLSESLADSVAGRVDGKVILRSVDIY